MKERPIIFSGEMVRAILAGRKTQTRRVMRPQPPAFVKIMKYLPLAELWRGGAAGCRNPTPNQKGWRCPYGIPSDRLWVREAIRSDSEDIYYLADGTSVYVEGFTAEQQEWLMTYGGDKNNITIPSIHMPRWASRIMREVMGVRVERVQDISEEDAKAEGVEAWHSPYPEIERYNRPGGSYRNGFHELWNSINAKRGFGWDVNPWIWVVEFKLLEGRTDNMDG